MTRFLTTAVLAVLATPALVTPALAAPPLAASDNIVVTANRSPRPLSEIGASVSVIGEREIATRQSVTIVDLLRTVPGVGFARNGGVGTVTSVFIRGADSDQTVALVDGVKVNDPSSPGAGFNFGDILTGNIARIEVVRGAQSVLWGSQAIGGVVNLITRAPTETPTLNARAEYGWRNTGQIVANASGTAGPVAASVGGLYYRSDGISAFDERLGGRERDGYDHVGANAKLIVTLSDAIALDLRASYADGRTDLDGFAAPSFAFGDTRDVNRTKLLVLYSGATVALFDGRFRNRIGYARTGIDRVTRNLANTPATVSFTGFGLNERLEYQGTITVARGVEAIVGVETERSRYRTGTGTGIQRARASIDSIYGQLTATPVAGLTLTGGVRRDDHSTFGGATTLAASGVYALPTGTTLRASYGEGFKVPSLFQLFSSNFGNRSLRPERAASWDAGIAQTLLDGRIEASATYFSRKTRDQIVFISCPLPRADICVDRPFGTYDSIARTQASGVEVALMLRPVDTLDFRAAYTRLDATNRANGLRLARRPRDSINAAIDWRGPGFSAGATIVHQGGSFDDALNTRRLGSSVTVDLRASIPILAGVEGYARLDNAFDDRTPTATGYGTPGAAGHVGVRLTL